MKTRGYTQVARAEAQERTRAALLDAAVEAFFAGRWDAMSLEAIAAEAGVTKQTLLRHFGSKQGLLEAAYERGFAAVRDQRMAAPSGDVEGAVDNLLDHYEAEGDRALALGAMPHPWAAAARRFHLEWVEHAFGPWLARSGERERLRAALVVACDVHAWATLARDLELPRAEVRETLVLIVRRLLEEDA